MIIDLQSTPTRKVRWVHIDLRFGYVVAIVRGCWNNGWDFPAECWIFADFEGYGG